MQRTIERTIGTDTLAHPPRAARAPGKAEAVVLPPPPREMPEVPGDRLSRRGGLLLVLAASLLGWAGIWWAVTSLLS